MRSESLRRPHWVVLTLFMTFALLAASCGDSDDDAAGDTTAGPDDNSEADEAATDDQGSGDEGTDSGDDGPAPELTASFTGVTEDTIRIGFTTSDLIKLKEIGLVDLDRGDPQLVLDALIDDVNERGGINGRMLEATLELVVPIDATAADEACLRFTEDIEVFAVLAPFTGPNTTVNSCINDRHATVIVGGQPTPEQLSTSKAPWISQDMFAARRLAGVVQLLEGEGLLGETVGVTVTAEEQDAADDIVIPALEALGKKVVSVVQTVPAGDTAAGAAAWETFIEKFKIEEVDSVVMVENTGTFGSSQLVVSDLDAEFLIVDSRQLVAGLAALGEVDPAELTGVIGSGAASLEEAWELESTQECVRVFEEANPDIDVVVSADVAPDGSDWLANILIFCAPLRLFEMAATAAGAELTQDSFLAGAEGLGEVEIPGQVFASMGPDKHDASDAIRLTEFDPNLGENGGAAPRGDLMRVD